jgi:hypothetical protein
MEINVLRQHWSKLNKHFRNRTFLVKAESRRFSQQTNCLEWPIESFVGAECNVSNVANVKRQEKGKALKTHSRQLSVSGKM